MNEQHPINNLMSTVMENIKGMVDVNTIIGEPIKAGEVTIIPVSRVAFGFGSGGSSFGTATKKGDENFGGGAGGGVFRVALQKELCFFARLAGAFYRNVVFDHIILRTNFLYFKAILL